LSCNISNLSWHLLLASSTKWYTGSNVSVDNVFWTGALSNFFPFSPNRKSQVFCGYRQRRRKEEQKNKNKGNKRKRRIFKNRRRHVRKEEMFIFVWHTVNRIYLIYSAYHAGKSRRLIECIVLLSVGFVVLNWRI